MLYRDGLPDSGADRPSMEQGASARRPPGRSHDGRDGQLRDLVLGTAVTRADKRYADLIVRAYKPADPCIRELAMRFWPSPRSSMPRRASRKSGCSLPAALEHTWSEYEQLLAELEPALEGLPLSELVEKEGPRTSACSAARRVSRPRASRCSWRRTSSRRERTSRRKCSTASPVRT